jgi:hypothetical protein
MKQQKWPVISKPKHIYYIWKFLSNKLVLKDPNKDVAEKLA